MTIEAEPRDETIAQAAIRGDEAAFRTLYEQLSTRVYNLVLRSVHEPATAEDICQEVWLKAHREIRTVQAPGALRTWLFRMASRACIDYSRSRAFRERSSPEIPEEMLDSAADEPEVVAVRRGELRVMWETLASMPPRQSLALYLKQVDGRSYDEIGQILDCPRTAVETLLFRARQGFARTHRQIEAEPGASCKMIGQAMAVVLDHEGTPFQQRAVEAHIADCRICREQMNGLAKGSAGYLWLPLLPAGEGALLVALAGGSAGGAGVGLGIGRLIQMLIANAQSGATVAAVVGAVGTAAAAGAVTGITPTPGEIADAVQQSSVLGGGGSSGSQLSESRPGADRITGGGVGGSGQPLAGIGTGPGTGSAPAPAGSPPAAPLDAPATPPPVAGPTQTVLEGTLGGVTETVNNTVENLTNVVGETVQGLVDTVTGVLQDPTGILQDPGATVGQVVEIVGETVEGTTGTVDQTVDDTTDVVDDLTGGGLSDVTETVDDTVDGVTDLVDDLLGPPEEEEPPCVLGFLFC